MLKHPIVPLVFFSLIIWWGLINAVPLMVEAANKIVSEVRRGIAVAECDARTSLGGHGSLRGCNDLHAEMKKNQ